jgi:RNA polymerase sigma factor (sigma-70 family)
MVVEKDPAPGAKDMAAAQLHRAVAHFRRVTRPPDAAEADGRLLARYLAHGDAAAFESLVRRHGPMVFGVCRRVLHNRHDAEDAFQATFLVLLRRARSLRDYETVGNWLYGAAHRTALAARRAAARRRAREAGTSPRPAWGGEERDDLHALLDQELARLPDRYRAAVVLCDLQERTRREAARLLRCSEGTVASRVARGRALLARRLTRRGVTLSAAAVAAALAPEATAAAVPAALLRAACWAAGSGSGPAMVLAKGVARAMAMTKLKVASAVLLVAGMVGAGVGPAALSGFADNGPAPAAGPKQVVRPASKPAAAARTETKVYAVGDLVIPPNPAAKPGQEVVTQENVLISSIKTFLAPGSWSDTEGPGTIDYFPATMSLVVKHTPEVQAQVESLLTCLRRAIDREERVKQAAEFMTQYNTLVRQGKVDEAIFLVSRAATLDPENATYSEILADWMASKIRETAELKARKDKTVEQLLRRIDELEKHVEKLDKK